jgi:heterodisulfide reductase subunit A-like polyferredoxin
MGCVIMMAEKNKTPYESEIMMAKSIIIIGGGDAGSSDVR